MEVIHCPSCGFPAHMISSNDKKYWKCICERPSCRRIFIIDIETMNYV